MVVWRIETEKRIIICYEVKSIFYKLADELNVPTEEAINAEAWSELACVDEVYEGQGFRISVEAKPELVQMPGSERLAELKKQFGK